MTEVKKPSIFKRLFGGQTEAPVAPEAEVPAPENHELAGPPETSVEYVEEIEAEAAVEPELVAPTPAVVTAPIAAVATPTAPPPKLSWLQRLGSGLKRSSDQLTGGITALFTKKKLDAATLDELEDILIQADFGVDIATTITETLRRDRFDRDVTSEDVRAVLAAEVEKVLAPVEIGRAHV